MIPWWLGLAAIPVLTVAGALVFGPTTARRLGAAAIGLATLSIPFLVAGGPALAVTACALLSVLGPIKTVQMAADATPRALPFRVWHATMPFDARKARPAAGGVRAADVGWLALHGVTFGAGVAVVLWSSAALPAPAKDVVRIAAGAFAIYGGSSAMASLYALGHRAVGVEIPPIMRAPILARSIAEFWSLRWNRAVHELLRAAFYAPLVRRGRARAGVFAAFAGSAALHAWIVVFALGLPRALVMGSFFVVQGVLALVEDRLHVRRWRPAAARAWTLGSFAVTCPLFVDPFLRALGM